jgi:myo-inositol-1(or 4)-monophosphatase
VPDFEAIVTATREAAELAHRQWREGAVPNVRVWEKSKGNPVCDIDLAVDLLLQERLGAILPDAAWLSEETVDDPVRLGANRLWLVDPIDGTRDYVRGRSGWCVSVALIEGGVPVFAVMAAPAQEKLWVAQAGHGASCNDERLIASTRQTLSGARVPTDELPKQLRDFEMVQKPNSIAMRMTMVACDRADLIATFRWGHEWDIAAAHLVAQEAGAKVTNGTGERILYNKRSPVDFGLICSAPGIHDAAVERFSAFAAKILAD